MIELHKEISFNLKDLDTIVQNIKEACADCSIITLSGPLGAGKTTLTKKLLALYGVTEDIVSPTFAYINQYKTADGTCINHFDLYRLRTIDDFTSQGFDEYLYEPGSLTIVEWPEIIEPLLEKNVCRITLDYADKPDERIMIVSKR